MTVAVEASRPPKSNSPDVPAFRIEMTVPPVYAGGIFCDG
jgi:hypothetical protein